MISYRRYRGYERSQMEAYYAPTSVSPAKSGSNVKEPTVKRWHPPKAFAENAPQVDKVRAMVRATPANGFIGCAAALADHDFRSGVATVTRPVSRQHRMTAVASMHGHQQATFHCTIWSNRCSSQGKSIGFLEVS